jgi:5-methylcytosine-specific restriction endonuclease McrA
MGAKSSPICPRCGQPKEGPCLPCKRASARAYIARNKAKVRAKNNVWKANNKERVDAKVAEYLANNKERIRQKAAEYHIANKALLNERSAAWRKANPEKCRIQAHDRRARVKGVGGALSKDIYERLFKLQKGKCACCGTPLGKDGHLDHIMPISMGGKNEDANVQLLTQRCNNQKHAKHPVDFMREKGFLL